jgi:hypothetical protein
MTEPSCTRSARILCVRLYPAAAAALQVTNGQFSTGACARLGLGQACAGLGAGAAAIPRRDPGWRAQSSRRRKVRSSQRINRFSSAMRKLAAAA